MRKRSAISTKYLPFTVTFDIQGVTKHRRFKDPESAWRFMIISGGSLNMAFRTF